MHVELRKSGDVVIVDLEGKLSAGLGDQILRDTIAVTKANLMDTVVKDKYHSYDDVYNGIPADQRPKRP